MTSTNDHDKRGCKPEWMHHNRLLSYCLKAEAPRGTAAEAEPADGQDQPACSGRQCLFALRRS